MAFFPCIYFTSSVNPLYFTLENYNYRNISMKQKYEKIIERADKRNDFYKLLLKFTAIVNIRGLRMLFENPFSTRHYLHNNFLKEPAIIDSDRTRRGDCFVKPTGYWFFNCEPTFGCSFQQPKEKKRVWESKRSTKAGLCSEERSMISPDYARNFICDFLLGKVQKHSQQTLF